ncbi:hypothetical protein POM88_005330 [Heracleum sosnowskyi]|uniref:rRNA N-glycosylase n=1 Tax=Heracleum sosnowskyi TaxID=360622 RepID=A0AAD8JJQ0_9APIA|nr:hypothetical protein POM88_005330 [Heracleum sosnowskyi]
MLVIVFSGAAEYKEINGNLAGYSSVTFDLTNVRTTKFGGGYTSLERDADVSGLDQQLGIPNFDGAIRSMYGRQENELNQGNGEAKFLLIAVQMVAEATRFQFIISFQSFWKHTIFRWKSCMLSFLTIASTINWKRYASATI